MSLVAAAALAAEGGPPTVGDNANRGKLIYHSGDLYDGPWTLIQLDLGTKQELTLLKLKKPGGVCISKNGLSLVYLSSENQIDDNPPERKLRVSLYERPSTSVPFGKARKSFYKLEAKYLESRVYDETSGNIYLDYAKGHH